MAASCIAATDGGPIAYLAQGDGPVIVLLHGIGSAASSWRAQLEALGERHRVIAWDAPGYGDSAHLPQPAPLAADYAARLACLLDTLGIASAHIVGHSLGALVAGSFALNHPRRVTSLTLASVAAGHARMTPDDRERLMRGRLDDLATLGARAMAEKRGPRLAHPDAPAAVKRAIIEAMSRIDPEGYGQAVRMLSQGDLDADVARLPADLPVQVLVGDADVITPRRRTTGWRRHGPAFPCMSSRAAGMRCISTSRRRSTISSRALSTATPDQLSRAGGRRRRAGRGRTPGWRAACRPG